MGKAKPTREAFDAAQEVLRRNPRAGGERSREDALAALADICMCVGLDRFRLIHGLRTPRTPIEMAESEFNVGRISKEEYHRIWEVDSQRPVDERMLREYFEAVENRIVALGRALLMVRRTPARHPEPVSADDQLRAELQAIRCRMRQSPPELVHVHEFTVEARLANRFELLKFAGTTWPTVGALATRVALHLDEHLGTAEVDWEIPPDRLAWFARAVGNGVFPEAGILQEESGREHAAARMLLRSQTSASAPVHFNVQSLSVTTPRCDFTASSVQLNGPAPAAPPGMTPAPFSVESWSQLVLGFDSKRVFAIRNPPAVEAEVRLEDADELKLTGKRWRLILSLACDHGGRRVPRKTFLGLVRKPADRSGGIPQDMSAANGLRARGPSDDRFLATTLSELRGQLRKEVTCPDDTAQFLLVDRGAEIDLGFQVLPLVSDGRGHFRIGSVGR